MNKIKKQILFIIAAVNIPSISLCADVEAKIENETVTIRIFNPYHAGIAIFDINEKDTFEVVKKKVARLTAIPVQQQIYRTPEGNSIPDASLVERIMQHNALGKEIFVYDIKI